MKAILYIGHGTRSKEGAAEAKQFLSSVINRIDAPIQEISFLELTKPFIDEGFERCVKRGATEITVIPLLLLSAGHFKEDIPNELAPLQKKHPHIQVKMADAFGVQGRILDAITELVKDTAKGVNIDDSLLIVGRGSSDPLIHEAFAQIKKGLADRLGISLVHVCYLAAATPRLKEGLEAISNEAAGRVIVIPYLLFAGLLLDEVMESVHHRQQQGQAIIYTDVLSRHRVIQDIVIERVTGKEPADAASYY
ncbi:sirohydrochlorin chelatase [Jeotgalibacillus soli]|uniref:Cobalamin biosynthesis protein CbiX n=1 Tax=Jeotgalibacillus soli TaxID=889306 RepID=A0A0C2RHK2_9BACL|nr:sirohydrochlorin chelatase [Jeotgalibacillus soli]KIL49650.1 cobalamin biosynthesis protein CbiX [Jeotgalibacillus soli]